MAEIYERLGEEKKALASYEQFVVLWKDRDPALRPSVEEARRRI